MKTINGLGWACPKPVIELKKALKEIDSGSIMIIVDDPTALNNITTFARESGLGISHTVESDGTCITLTKTGDQGESAGQSKDLVIVISGNILGKGSDELGANLMKSYLYSLTEVEEKPKTLIFMNSGVYLTTEGTLVKESLDSLEDAGVEIISCGACLNFYGLENKLVKGSVGNMYLFAEKMNKAANTILI